MSMKDAAAILLVQDFRDRLKIAIARTAIAAQNEQTNDVQSITITGTPTGGSASVGGLPSTYTHTYTGTLTSASASVTGLPSTVGLFVGLNVTGANVPAGTTVASITSATAITLSANATGSGATALTFSGTAVVVIPFNATAALVQSILQTVLGTNSAICSGGPLPGTGVNCTFADYLGGTPQKLMVVAANNLTGGASPNATIAKVTNGASAPLHAQRAVLAKAALMDLDKYVNIFGPGVTDNATIQTDYSGTNHALSVAEATVDNDLAFTVSSNWNAYTG